MQLFYQNVDIFEKISLHTCIYDSFGEERPDSLRLVFNDGYDQWDNWRPQKGDTVRAVLGACDTGTMYVKDISPQNGKMQIRASAIPDGVNEKNSKSWEAIHFKQLVREIGARHGLTAEFYDVEDQVYEYVNQANREDFVFLEERCVLEGCAFLVYNQKLIVYNESKLEQKGAKGNLHIPSNVKFDYADRSEEMYGSCEISNGSVSGTYTAGAGKALNRILNIRISSAAEANRFAKNLLRYENKKMTQANITSDVFLPGYVAGSMINIETEGATSWNGNIFCNHVRHDLVKASTKLFFRKPLEGY